MAKPIRKKPTKKTSIGKSLKKKKSTPKKAASPAAPSGMHDAREVVHERRFETRNLVSKVTFAALSLHAEKFTAPDFVFTVDISGLLVDTSQGGCSLVFMKANAAASQLKREMKCVIQITPEA